MQVNQRLEAQNIRMFQKCHKEHDSINYSKDEKRGYKKQKAQII